MTITAWRRTRPIELAPLPLESRSLGAVDDEYEGGRPLAGLARFRTGFFELVFAIFFAAYVIDATILILELSPQTHCSPGNQLSLL
jgi:hypothetical protein